MVYPYRIQSVSCHITHLAPPNFVLHSTMTNHGLEGEILTVGRSARVLKCNL